MFISKPVQARVNKQWSFILSRRASAPDGTMLGVVMLAVDPFYFSDFYKDLMLGPDRFVSIIGLDGIVRSRLADGEAVLGQDVSRDDFFQRVQKKTDDAFVITSVADPISRVFAFRVLKDYPMAVTVATALEWNLSEVNRGAIVYRGIAAVFTATVLLLATAVVVFGVRREAERRLREQKAALEAAVAARTAELSAQQKTLVDLNVKYLSEREAATKANEAKSDFLSNMSHELRTPLNSIIGFSQLMATDEDIDQKNRESAELIHRSGCHLLDLINEVLDLDTVEARRIALSIEPVDCASLVEESVAMVRAVADMRGVKIETGALAGLTVKGDRTRLRQILINFLSNAVKYNRPSGRVLVDARRGADGRILLRVEDTGFGIEPSRMKELFLPFNRLGAEKTGVEGAGIGLALTRRLAELMGGSVGAESELGQGSRFWVEMAACDAPPRAATAPKGDISSKPRDDGAAGAKIVYIEDNPSNVALVKKVLSRLDRVEVLTAHMPGLGIDLVKANKPALVLLDINMPDMNGYDVLNVLKSDPETRTIPVIAVTAAAMDRDLEKGRGAGFADYVTKPLDVGKFLNVVSARLSA